MGKPVPLQAVFAALAAILTAAVCGGPMARSASAQPGPGAQTPSASYYIVFNPFYDGDYLEALHRFQSESNGSIKTAAVALDRLDLLRDDVRGMFL